MTAVIIVLAIAVAGGVPLGVWLSRQAKRQPQGTAAAGRENSHRSTAGLGFTCAACGHAHDVEQIRRQLYLGQRALGTIEAYQRHGMLGVGKRLVRRRITRTVLRELWK